MDARKWKRSSPLTQRIVGLGFENTAHLRAILALFLERNAVSADCPALARLVESWPNFQRRPGGRFWRWRKSPGVTDEPDT